LIYSEKSLQCSECRKTFLFTSREQEFFASKGFIEEPGRCPTCRRGKKAERSGTDGGSYTNRGPRQLFSPHGARMPEFPGYYSGPVVTS
jgi:hypothetical protein